MQGSISFITGAGPEQAIHSTTGLAQKAQGQA
jgi:hypothetical protein